MGGRTPGAPPLDPPMVTFSICVRFTDSIKILIEIANESCKCRRNSFGTVEFFHNSRLIRRIEQKYFQKIDRLGLGLNLDRLLSCQPL